MKWSETRHDWSISPALNGLFRVYRNGQHEDSFETRQAALEYIQEIEEN